GAWSWSRTVTVNTARAQAPGALTASYTTSSDRGVSRTPRRRITPSRPGASRPAAFWSSAPLRFTPCRLPLGRFVGFEGGDERFGEGGDEVGSGEDFVVAVVAAEPERGVAFAVAEDADDHADVLAPGVVGGELGGLRLVLGEFGFGFGRQDDPFDDEGAAFDGVGPDDGGEGLFDARSFG